MEVVVSLILLGLEGLNGCKYSWECCVATIPPTCVPSHVSLKEVWKR